MKEKQRSFLAMLIALSLGVLALLSPSCGIDGGTVIVEPEKPTATPTPTPACPLSAEQVLTASDGSEVTLYVNTDIDPCSWMTIAHIPLKDLPDQDCLPCDPERAAEGGCLFSQAKSIVAIDVLPDGRTFKPSAQLSYKLPTPWPGQEGDTLYIYQRDPEPTCIPEEGQTSWHSVTTKPAKVTNGLDRAIGEFNETCVFLLVNLQGRFNAMGTLLQPIGFEPDDTLFVTLDVVGSSTNHELEGQPRTFGLYGVQYPPGIDALFDLLKSRFPPDTMLLLHLESTGNMVIWSDREVAQFTVGSIDWP